MPRNSSTPPSAPIHEPIERVPVAAIVAMVGRGMTASEILKVFPELRPEDIRSALLRAADIVGDVDASLTVDNVGRTIRDAQRSAAMSEDDATELAARETRAVRSARAAGRKSRA